METLSALAPFIATAAIAVTLGAAVGYLTGYTDAMRPPRYRRGDVGEMFRVTSPSGLYIETPSRAAAEDFSRRYGGDVGRSE